MEFKPLDELIEEKNWYDDDRYMMGPTYQDVREWENSAAGIDTNDEYSSFKQIQSDLDEDGLKNAK